MRYIIFLTVFSPCFAFSQSNPSLIKTLLGQYRVKGACDAGSSNHLRKVSLEIDPWDYLTVKGTSYEDVYSWFERIDIANLGKVMNTSNGDGGYGQTYAWVTKNTLASKSRGCFSSGSLCGNWREDVQLTLLSKNMLEVSARFWVTKKCLFSRIK
ncbi:hypothetical protein K2X05_02545 [bacterium]|nr:hypothetical protein [bacterium]